MKRRILSTVLYNNIEITAITHIKKMIKNTTDPWLVKKIFLLTNTSVWNLLSHKYREVLIGLKGSKSILTFFSFPSDVTIVPQ